LPQNSIKKWRGPSKNCYQNGSLWSKSLLSLSFSWTDWSLKRTTNYSSRKRIRETVNSTTNQLMVRLALKHFLSLLLLFCQTCASQCNRFVGERFQ
jgi:hypothetical protein